LSQLKLPRRLLELVVAHGVQYLLWLLSWWMVGRAALEGRLDRGWLLAWALLLVTLVPFQVLVTWLQGRLAIGAGALLKRRLLAGALRLEPEEVRNQGAGQHLGRVMESEQMESLALTGGFLGLVAAIELLLAAAVLAAGAGGGPHAVLLAAWTAASLLLCARYLRQRGGWTEARLAMTHDLVERMVGYRTRLAQEERRYWHDAEDRALERYLDVSRPMDRTAALVAALVPRGWLVLGLVGLGPSFVSGRGSPAALAVAIGGVLLAYRALRRLAAGLTHLAGAAITWKQVAPLFRAAARSETAGLAPLADAPCSASPTNGSGRRLMEAHNLVFRYGGRGDPLLRGCSLQIRAGERLLLEGASGAGKSTFASLLSGLRHPESGLLLLGGLDRHSLGADGWRRRVVFAPQFHENHVLTGTFAFNALLGRDGTAPDASARLEAVCRGLGLGELLDRMPAGLLQMVGETGWQLSHGERSRLYMARALLQDADLVLLDESFAALDPENLERALRYVLERANTLLVVAHP
jgi:ATP-binding cassette subfamily B protein